MEFISTPFKNVNDTRTLKSIKLLDDILVMLIKSGIYMLYKKS